MFRYFLFRLGQLIVQLLPVKLSYGLAVILSDLQYYFSSSDRAAVINNLKVICGPKANVAPMAKNVFRHFGKYLVEFFLMDKIPNKEFVERQVQVHNLSAIDKVLKEGKGGIMLTAHIGNWELGAALLSYLGYPATVIALPHKERSVNEMFNEKRRSKGIEVVPSHFAVRRCMETLKNNKLVALVADREFGSQGIEIDFLGKISSIPQGAAIFAQKTGAPIIPCFMIRKDDDRFMLLVEDPIYPLEPSAETDRANSVVKLMKKYLTVIENMIRNYPDQWLVFRQFWV